MLNFLKCLFGSHAEVNKKQLKRAFNRLNADESIDLDCPRCGKMVTFWKRIGMFRW